MAGNFPVCDPGMTTLTRTTGSPVTQTFRGIAHAEHFVTITNGNPGLTELEIEANGKKLAVGGLRNKEVRTVNVVSAMNRGNGSVILLTALGKPSGSADVCIHD